MDGHDIRAMADELARTHIQDGMAMPRQRLSTVIYARLRTCSPCSTSPTGEGGLPPLRGGLREPEYCCFAHHSVVPPSTEITAPVTYDPALEDR